MDEIDEMAGLTFLRVQKKPQAATTIGNQGWLLGMQSPQAVKLKVIVSQILIFVCVKLREAYRWGLLASKLMTLDNRYAALSSTEETPDVQSEKHALAPRETASLESKISTPPAALERNTHHAKKPQSVRHESAAMPGLVKIVGASKSEATFPGANVSATLTDAVEHVAPTGVVTFQPQSALTGPSTDCSSTVTYLPSFDSTYSSASWLDKDQAGIDPQQNHEESKYSSNPALGISSGEVEFAAAPPVDNRGILDDFFDPRFFQIELPNNDTTLAVPPPIHQKRGWPSPTNSPAAPTTCNRKSRFFPTLPNILPEISKSDHRAQVEPHYSFPLLYHPPDPATWGLSTPAPSTDIIKPRLKKSPPPPIATSRSPLSSPILIRKPRSYFDSCFNPNIDSIFDFQVPPPEAGVMSSDISKHDEKNFILTTQHPEPMNEPQKQNFLSPKSSQAETLPHGQETGIANRERDEGKEVDKLQIWLHYHFKTLGANLKDEIKALEKQMQDVEARGRKVQQETEAMRRKLSLDAETWEGLEKEFWGVV